MRASAVRVGIVNLSRRGMLVVSVGAVARVGKLFCSPIMLPRSNRAGRKKGSGSANLTMPLGLSQTAARSIAMFHRATITSRRRAESTNQPNGSNSTSTGVGVLTSVLKLSLPLAC